MVAWDVQLETGVEKIDAQHKHLFELASMAHDLLNREPSKENLKETEKILNELKAYTITHFDDEENYMKSINCPNLNTHILEHSAFRAKVYSMSTKTEDMSNLVYPLNLLNTIIDWIVKHILITDKNSILPLAED